MKEITLTKGKVAMVDDADFESLSIWKWTATAYKMKGRLVWYAKRSAYLGRIAGNPIRKHVKMHREIMGASSKLGIDHRDGNGLNNQRSNLRAATRSQNQYNRRKAKGCASKFKGVSRCGRAGKWQVEIKSGGKRMYLGRYWNERDAAIAYNSKAMELHGDFALLNVLP